MNLIPLKSNVRLGVVPTHLKFVGGLVPDENGKVPRNAEGVLIVVDDMRKLTQDSLVKISCVQIPYFPGLDEEDVAEMVREFRALDLEVQFILMVGGADPMNPADEDAVVAMLVGGLNAAKNHGISHVSFAREDGLHLLICRIMVAGSASIVEYGVVLETTTSTARLMQTLKLRCNRSS